MEDDPRIKLDIFDERTTYSNDYRKFTPDKREKYLWPKNRFEKIIENPRPKPNVDPESFIRWKNYNHIPFTMYIKPRPIIDTAPTDVYNPKLLEKYEDDGKEKAIQTRPRIYKSPAVSVDDVPDQKMRSLLCQYMYGSDRKKAAEEAAGPQTPLPRPHTTFEPSANPVPLQTSIFPLVPPGCREQAKSWDTKQRRALVDPTKMFWLHKDPPVRCGACENPTLELVPKEVKDKIGSLIQKDKLRLPHDRLMPGYAGYKPKLATLPLSKVNLPVVHPFLSTSQAATQRYADDKKDT